MDSFNFNISLSVLNHLGRNLYRNFITVLGEAVSNSWDADAKNVWIYLDREKNYLVIKDDGIGMTSNDFQNKFLKIGYSKRKDGDTHTPSGRPYIGRKGIGKLALLSCAKEISIITKTFNSEYTKGKINNKNLDNAIEDDLNASAYRLENVNMTVFNQYTKNHESGTIIYFDELTDGIRNRIAYIKTLIALYFRFSLIDDSFNIYLNDVKIDSSDLDSFAVKTQYLWIINSFKDPYLIENVMLSNNCRQTKNLSSTIPIKGFIASVNKPSDLKIRSTDEKVSIDLYVNGRLREKDILKHIPTSRIVESYLYGQIHYDDLDDDLDRFTSSREGVLSDDNKFKKMLNEIKVILATILDDWDKFRIEDRKDGDKENKRLTKKERKSKELANAVSDDYIPPKGSTNRDRVDKWVEELSIDAEFNIAAYAECFISENLLRNFIEHKNLKLSPEMTKNLKSYKIKETKARDMANISFEIRRDNNDLLYFSMDDLSNFIDKPEDRIKSPGLSRDACTYKPIRDAMAHTSLLTDTAKNQLSVTFENIKSRVKKLLTHSFFNYCYFFYLEY